MNQNDKKLKYALLFSIVVNLFYGFAFFIVPGVLRDAAGGNPVELGWIRWSGGVLLALAIGGIQVYRKPAKQSAMVNTLTVAPVLIGAGLLYTLLFEPYTVHSWFIIVPCIVSFVLFAVMAWARQGAKDIL